MSPEAVAVAARDWSATATALLETAERLAALVPEAEDRLHGRTGDVAAEALRDAVRELRLDAVDAADGGTALADVAAALEEVRRDPSPQAQDLLGLRVREATRVMRRIHASPTPPRPPEAGVAGVPVTGTGPRVAAVSGQPSPLAPAVGVGSALAAGLLTAARSPASVRPPGAGRHVGVPGTTNPAGRGRSRRDRGSRDRHTHHAGIEECWTDDEGAGPAVLGAGQ